MYDYAMFDAAAHTNCSADAADIDGLGHLLPFFSGVVIACHQHWNTEFEAFTTPPFDSSLLNRSSGKNRAHLLGHFDLDGFGLHLLFFCCFVFWLRRSGALLNVRLGRIERKCSV